MQGTMELGGNISLTGFSEIEPGMMVVVKKIVGNYAKRFSESLEGFQNISLTLKPIHGTKKFEMNAKLSAQGKIFTAEVTDFNLFVILDLVLKKVEAQAG